MKYWAFDLDGTLVDSFQNFFSIIESIIQRKLNPQERLVALTIQPHEYFNQWLPSEKVEEALLTLRRKSRENSNQISPFENISAILSHLHTKGDKIAVWTSRGYESADLILKNNNFYNFIEFLVSGDCLKNKKPHHEGLEKIQNHFSCTPEQMIMVGDHIHDMEAAKALGVFCVRASWHQYWNEADCHLSDKQFRNTQDFLNWISYSSEEQ